MKDHLMRQATGGFYPFNKSLKLTAFAPSAT